MAMCEKCNKSGYYPMQMSIDTERDQFVGPCCATATCLPVWTRPTPAHVQVLPFQQQKDELEYGVEISNKVGVKAYANYNGLQVSFERSPAQLRKWAESQGLMSA